ncbi:MAG: lactate racemase domain-containing protein [Terriglobia bacterium]
MRDTEVKMSTGAYESPPRFHYLERISPSAPAVEHVEDEIHATLSGLNVPDEKLRGRKVGITVGSRGVASLKEITRAACQWLKDCGAHPFIFPAMGSHGGATAEGQRKILEDYGVTPDFVAAPVRSSMETALLGETPEGFPVYADRLAWQADGIMVMHRVKPHTAFSGTIESGLLKMMAVGMGKAEGAREFHRAAQHSSYEKAIRAMAAKVLAGSKVLCGLAVIENEMHQICAVRAALPEGLVALDESCLAEARRLVPRLPFAKIDLLIVDEIGKNISGTGMDAKLIGRGVQFQPDEAPEIKLIYARDLTAESNGNALGIGLADFVHERLRRKIDFEKMYVNARTSMSHRLVRLPMVLCSDREALAFALEVLGQPEPPEPRIAWIRNTQYLGRLAISERLALEVPTPAGWRLAAQGFQPGFGPDGNLLPFGM